MIRQWQVCSIALVAGLSAGAEQTWKDKRVAEWSTEDANRVLTDSPWAKSVAPTIDQSSSGRRGGRGMGMPGGGMGGIGMGGRGGMGGGGMGGRGMGGRGMDGGMGRPGTDRSGSYPNDRQEEDGASPTTLKLRWESAFPVREAELKTRNNGVPSIDESQYAIAVFGLPARMGSGDPATMKSRLKPQASLKREGKKPIKASDVQFLAQEDGPIVLFLFPRSKEIALADKEVEFAAKIGRIEISQKFQLSEMNYAGKFEL